MKHVIIGTAGHVDHGKTTLIQALTGTNPDRLKEEQERGMTIDLGFAALTLPDGTKAGIVDVPGHERFLKNMLAGAGGVDVVLLVVAADESVMPQTVEHMDILRLLDVKNGVVALTKADMVDEEWLQVAEEDVRGRLEGTFLENAPVIAVDSLSGRGLPELKKALLSAVSRAEAKNAAAPFRLPVDRVFTRQGFGTVVTGTLVAGTLHVGDSVEILPHQIRTRVRGLQSHGKKSEVVEAGSRTAVNLAGVETEALERGALLVPPGTLAPTQLFDAVLRMLPSAAKPLANRARVRVYIGTAEILGRVQVLGQDEIEPGKQGYVQLRGEFPFACARGDRFVLRTYSPMHTVAGGIVLDPAPSRHRRKDPAVIAALEAKERGAPDDLLATWLQTQPLGALLRDAAKPLGLTEADALEAAKVVVDRGEALPLDSPTPLLPYSPTPHSRLIHPAALAAATDRAMNALAAFHAANQLRPGMPKEELRGSLGRNADPRAFGALLARWQAEGLITTDATTARRADFRVQLNARQQSLLDRIAALYKETGIQVPFVQEAAEEIGAPPDAIAAMLRVGMDQELIVRVNDELYFHAETMASLRKLVEEHICAHGSITVSQFRDATGSSRKYALPIMEYFDSIKLTRRRGDDRVLADQA